MNKLIKLLNSETGSIIISVIWGLGLAALFSRACKGRYCIVYKSPHPSKIQNKTFKFEDKCYKYASTLAKCHDTEEQNVKLDNK